MSAPLKVFPGNQRYTAARNAMADALRAIGDLTQQELLAVASHMVGQLIAFQDQTSLTNEQAMEIVLRNIEQGNASAIQNLLGNPIGAA